ncbi:MAG: RNA-binding S4 domain-containing protein [Actinomycetales bacterium]|nr:RNA-binding S4 domain-containing protein [Actinomycetales bacterium]
MSEVRVDAWVWSVRLAGSRSAATAMCRAGHVRIGGERVKPAQRVRVGDEVRVLTPGGERIVVVRELLAKRVGAPLARAAYDDLTPEAPPRVERPAEVRRDRGAGRPTKRDRRAIEQLRGH